MNKALIIGGSRGIGAATVRAFAGAGYRVAFTYLHATDAALSLAQETGAVALCADIADRSAVRAAVSQARDTIGAPDVLIVCAGIAQTRLLTDITPEDWDAMIATNLSGPFYAAQAAAPGMISRKSGCMLFVSSMWGQVGASCESHYAAAKAGLIGLMKSLAMELAPSGIRVNCVAPGAIRTDMLNEYGEETLRLIADETPLGRLGQPDEIARSLLFLASDAASYITGQVLGVNGGRVV